MIQDLHSKRGPGHKEISALIIFKIVDFLPCHEVKSFMTKGGKNVYFEMYPG